MAARCASADQVGFTSSAPSPATGNGILHCLCGALAVDKYTDSENDQTL